MAKWHTLTTEEALKQLNSTEKGLTTERVQKLQREHGFNSIEAAKPKSKWMIFISQFKDVMILILFVAAVISFSVGERVDAFVILAIILGNALIGFFQEAAAD